VRELRFNLIEQTRRAFLADYVDFGGSVKGETPSTSSLGCLNVDFHVCVFIDTDVIRSLQLAPTYRKTDHRRA
jgi:hypothetical protein